MSAQHKLVLTPVLARAAVPAAAAARVLRCGAVDVGVNVSYSWNPVPVCTSVQTIRMQTPPAARLPLRNHRRRFALAQLNEDLKKGSSYVEEVGFLDRC